MLCIVARTVNSVQILFFIIKNHILVIKLLHSFRKADAVLLVPNKLSGFDRVQFCFENVLCRKVDQDYCT
jgi:hypothetical protein